MTQLLLGYATVTNIPPPPSQCLTTIMVIFSILFWLSHQPAKNPRKCIPFTGISPSSVKQVNAIHPSLVIDLSTVLGYNPKPLSTACVTWPQPRTLTLLWIPFLLPQFAPLTVVSFWFFGNIQCQVMFPVLRRLLPLFWNYLLLSRSQLKHPSSEKPLEYCNLKGRASLMVRTHYFLS